MGRPALVESIRTHGEVSVDVLDGRLTQRLDRQPGADDVRVDEEFGGRVAPSRWARSS